MTISIASRDEIFVTEIPLLNDAVPGSVDYKGRPSVRSKSGRWKSAPFIIAAGVAERFAYYGISLNLISYLTGELGQPTATAAALLNAWYGVAGLLPILGAFVADSFSGRFRMIIVSFVLYIPGLFFLAFSASLQSTSKCIPVANNTACSPPQLQTMILFCSLYLVALAQGGLAPCDQAFGANQFDEYDEDERRSTSSFFNLWSWLTMGVILVPLLVLTYIQENVSWELGFGIPTVVMCFALIVFSIGTMKYRFRINEDERNPFVRIYRVFVKATRNFRAAPIAVVSIEEDVVLPHKTTQFKFLDRALLSADSLLEDEKICTISDVEDAKSILRLAPIWLACLGYSIVYAQPSTLFTKQAATMDRHINATVQIPAASLQQCFIAIPIIFGLPIYDRVFVPVARKITKEPSGISMLTRIRIGLFLSLASIVFAALIEKKRLAMARKLGLLDSPLAMIPMSVWWLAPQYVLSGIADVFTMVGLQEFFYDQVPIELKSIGLAMYLSILGTGNLLSSFLVSTIQNATSRNGQDGWFSDNLNRAHLDYFYWLLAGLSTAGFTTFIYLNNMAYVYRGDDDNMSIGR